MNNGEINSTNPPVDENQINKKKKKKPLKIIVNIIMLLFAIIMVLEAGIGVINMQRISNKEEPIWYLSMKKNETESKIVIEYNLGLYKIVKTSTKKETKITLKPFFIGD